MEGFATLRYQVSIHTSASVQLNLSRMRLRFYLTNCDRLDLYHSPEFHSLLLSSTRQRLRIVHQVDLLSAVSLPLYQVRDTRSKKIAILGVSIRFQ